MRYCFRYAGLRRAFAAASVNLSLLPSKSRCRIADAIRRIAQMHEAGAVVADSRCPRSAPFGNECNRRSSAGAICRESILCPGRQSCRPASKTCHPQPWRPRNINRSDPYISIRQELCGQYGHLVPVRTSCGNFFMYG